MDGPKEFAIKVSPNDKVSDVVRRIPSSACSSRHDVYVTCEGRVLRRSDELKNFGIGDGSAVQITSRVRGGGMHKDKKTKSEKKHATNPKESELLRREQEEKCEEEQKSDEGPVTQRIDKESAMRQLEENEGYQKIIDCVSEGSEGEMEQTLQNYLAWIQGVSGLDQELLEDTEGAVRRAVEARRKRRGTEREQTAEMEQGKKARFAEEQQAEETRTQSTDEKDAMSGLEEVRTGRGSAGLVRGWR